MVDTQQKDQETNGMPLFSVPLFQSMPTRPYETPTLILRDVKKDLSELLRPNQLNVVSNNTPAFLCADGSTTAAYFSLVVPNDYLISSIKFLWSTPATSGNLYWQIDIGEGGNSDATNARTTGGTAIATAADSTANELSFTEILTTRAGVDFTKVKKGNLWGIKWSRLGGNTLDTLSDAVNLYGILVKYR